MSEAETTNPPAPETPTSPGTREFIAGLVERAEPMLEALGSMFPTPDQRTEVRRAEFVKDTLQSLERLTFTAGLLEVAGAKKTAGMADNLVAGLMTHLMTPLDAGPPDAGPVAVPAPQEAPYGHREYSVTPTLDAFTYEIPVPGGTGLEDLRVLVGSRSSPFHGAEHHAVIFAKGRPFARIDMLPFDAVTEPDQVTAILGSDKLVVTFPRQPGRYVQVQPAPAPAAPPSS